MLKFSTGDKVFVYAADFYEDGNIDFIQCGKLLNVFVKYNFPVIPIFGNFLYEDCLENFWPEYVIVFNEIEIQKIKNDRCPYYTINQNTIDCYHLDKSFLGYKGNYFRDSAIFSAKEGHNCCVCKDYYEYAIVNQSNGTFGCYRCRIDLRNRLENVKVDN